MALFIFGKDLANNSWQGLFQLLQTLCKCFVTKKSFAKKLINWTCSKLNVNQSFNFNWFRNCHWPHFFSLSISIYWDWYLYEHYLSQQIIMSLSGSKRERTFWWQLKELYTRESWIEVKRWVFIPCTLLHWWTVINVQLRGSKHW